MRNSVTKKAHTIITEASRSTPQATGHHPLPTRAMRGKGKAQEDSSGLRKRMIHAVIGRAALLHAFLS